MYSYLLSDNIDTILGLRIVGIKSKQVDESTFLDSFNDLLKDESVVLILITSKLYNKFITIIEETKIRLIEKVILEIPTRLNSSDYSLSIDSYISKATGVKNE